MFKFAFLALSSLAALEACGGSNVVVNQQTATAATQMEKSTATMVQSFAQTTPPMNAQSVGMQSQPQAGSVAIPIQNVEVYEFSANIDDQEGDETLYWATDGNTVYVWGEIGLTCVDDQGAETGETGTGYFVFEAEGDTYGWLAATDSCGYSTYLGCSNDGGGDVCGECDFNSEAIACVAAGS